MRMDRVRSQSALGASERKELKNSKYSESSAEGGAAAAAAAALEGSREEGAEAEEVVMVVKEVEVEEGAPRLARWRWRNSWAVSATATAGGASRCFRRSRRKEGRGMTSSKGSSGSAERVWERKAWSMLSWESAPAGINNSSLSDGAEGDGAEEAGVVEEGGNGRRKSSS